MLILQKGDKVTGKIVDKTPVVIEGEIISVLEKTVIVSTATQGNVVIKKSDLTVMDR